MTKPAANAPDSSSEAANEKAQDEMYLPPRRIVHPSAQGKLLRIFYAGLLIGFVALVAGLTIWGYHRNG